MNAARPPGAYAGVVVGYLGWLIGLAILCLSTARLGILLDVLAAGLAVSVGLALATILTLEAVTRAWPEDRDLFQLALWGRLLFDIGVLLLFLRLTVLPRIAEDERLASALGALGGTTSVPNWLVLLGLAAGCVVTFLAVRRALARRSGPGSS